MSSKLGKCPRAVQSLLPLTLGRVSLTTKKQNITIPRRFTVHIPHATSVRKTSSTHDKTSNVRKTYSMTSAPDHRPRNQAHQIHRVCPKSRREPTRLSKELPDFRRRQLVSGILHGNATKPKDRKKRKSPSTEPADQTV